MPALKISWGSCYQQALIEGLPYVLLGSTGVHCVGQNAEKDLASAFEALSLVEEMSVNELS